MKLERLSEVIYKIKPVRPAGSYSSVKTRVVNFNPSAEPATRTKAGPRLREDLLGSCVVIQHKRAVMRE